jgi:peroxiredoxin Q/BCP
MQVRALFSVLALAAAALPAKAEDPVVVEEFTVRQADGDSTFRLSEARGKYVAIHFLLKTACPYCVAHTHDYARRAAERGDLVNVFLKPDTDEEIAKWTLRLKGKFERESTASPLPVIFRDPDAELAKRFGIPDGYEFHGQTVHFPALVLVDPEGREVFRYVGKKNSDRYPFDDLARKIDELER